jgi:hypothetical protein
VTDGLCACGCSGTTSLAPHNDAKRGLVKGQPRRFIHGHAKRKPWSDMWLAEDRGFRTPCHIWQGGKGGGGYGRTRDGLIQRPAHVVGWERVNGPLPAGTQLDHLCFESACINVEHLDVVTPAINVRRRRCAKLTEADVTEIRREWGAASRTDLATRFGVHPAYIGQILRGDRWAA